MIVTTPTINKIIKLTEFDLLRTSIKMGNMYMCVDSHKLYYDETQNNRTLYNYTSVKTVNDLRYNITPEYGLTYYCWEDNSLWLWLNKWITLWSDSTYPSAYIYDESNQLQSVYRNDQPLLPADDNGLLHDGSVVIRDRQRIIKGKLYVEDSNDNLTISSFLGGGIRLLPNGKMDSDGELLIGDEGKSFLRSEMHFKDNEVYVDYSDNPSLDKSINKNDKHLYMVYHEGNTDPSVLKVLTPEDIYNKLLDPSLQSKKPFDFDVKMLNGRTADSYSLITHTHKSSEILDFAEKVEALSSSNIYNMFNDAEGKGILIDYDETLRKLTLTAKSFRLSLSEGVTGQATINELGDTDIIVRVNPEKHIHQNYVETMASLQEQINNIGSIDPHNYYTVREMDKLLDDIKGTATATPGKPLLVDESGKLPAPSTQSDSLSKTVDINFTGDVTGLLTTDFSDSSYDVQLDASKILSVTPEPGKALKVNDNNDLPGNAETSSALDHNIELNLTGQARGSVIIDTHKDLNSNVTTVNLETTLIPGDNILQTKDIGDKVASLDSSGKVPESQLPYSIHGSLTYMGVFNPNTGIYPSEQPYENQYWTASENGILFDEEFFIGDWLLYQDNKWQGLHFSYQVKSVNGLTGDVILKADDIDALSKDLIDYGSLWDEIPSEKIVTTFSEGYIRGARVDGLYKNFYVRTLEDSEVILKPVQTSETGTNSEYNNYTDGTTDITMKLILADSTYTKIQEKVSTKIKDGSGNDLGCPKTLTFSNDFIASKTGDDITITMGKKSDSFTTTLGDNKTKEFKITHNLNTENIIVQFRIYDTGEECFVNNQILDANTIAVTTDTTLPDNYLKVFIKAL